MTQKAFEKLFKEARKRDAYWVASVILDFTEELEKMMKAKGISRSDLARTVGVSPAYITKVLRGNINFTVDSMVRLTRAMGAMVHIHVAPETHEVCWFDVIKGRFPHRRVLSWERKTFQPASQGKIEEVGHVESSLAA